MQVYRNALRAPGLNIAVLGYALFLVINACSLWGGVFPFFPREFHGEEVTFAFMLAQSLVSLATYIVVLICSFKMPSIILKSLHGVSSFPAFMGGVLLVAALYAPAWRVGLVAAAGCCMGCGGTLLSLVWARYFSAESSDRGNFFILAGTFSAPILFALLYLVPQAVRVFLIPLIFVPLCGLSVLLSFRQLDKNSPIFQDTPATNIPSYMHIVRVYWKSAFAIGTLGFASGLVRAIAVADVRMGDITNGASFAGLLIAAALLLSLWQRRSFTLNLHFVFMASFPLVALCLAFFPFVGGAPLAFISGIVFLLFSVANIIVMLQSAHICMNRGCNPFFVYGFFGSTVSLLQNSGFIFGHIAMAGRIFGEQTAFAVSIIGLLVLTITLYIFVGKKFTSDLPQYDNVEFIAFNAKTGKPGKFSQIIKRNIPAAPLDEPGIDASASDVADADEPHAATTGASDAASADPPHAATTGTPNAAWQASAARPSAAANASSPAAGADEYAPQTQESDDAQAETHGKTPLHDVYRSAEKAPSRITMRCKMLQEQYRLTSRETEIMELIVRGYSVARIAEEHVVSENTVRTHYKHIYAKLSVHKKQELIAMVDALKDKEAL